MCVGKAPEISGAGGSPIIGPAQKQYLLIGLWPSTISKQPCTRKRQFCSCWGCLWWPGYIGTFSVTSSNLWTSPTPRLHANQILIINFTITTKQCWQTSNCLFDGFMVWPRLKHANSPGQLSPIFCKWECNLEHT